ncbi:MAG: PhnD/SsuA/transferrin family substrate-binding protein [bacterium]|nr:PhnD/SsuA/transferrin family substrate-binding protein [bacterium]
MKNKLKIVDVSLLSNYLGKWLTVVVATIVIGLALHAIVATGGSSERNIVSICMPDTRSPEGKPAYEPLRSLVRRETRRPVELSTCAGEWTPGHDLYVMPIAAYFRHAELLDVEALFEITDSERRTDSAVLISRPGDTVRASDGPDYSGVSADDVAFVSPNSINGFWIQAARMQSAGFDLPETIEAVKFEGKGDTVERVIFGVIYGSYRLGACRLSDVTSLFERGVIRRGEVRILQKYDSLPEVVIAAHPGEANYYRRKLKNIGESLAGSATTSTPDETVELLKSSGFGGLWPITDERLAGARKLYEQYAALYGASQIQ